MSNNSLHKRLGRLPKPFRVCAVSGCEQRAWKDHRYCPKHYLRDVRHGDLRPKHLLLGRSGIAITGFGLVEALDLAAAGSAGSTAVTIGAPAYLSPEQLSGETSADERSDLYSVGCILFEMLAGEAPFAGSNMAAVLSRKLTQPAPRVRSLRESVAPALETFVERCLARLPADRFQRATEAREALLAAR